MKYIPILSLNFHALYAGLMYMLCGLVGVKLGREAFDVVRCLVLVMAHCFGSVPCVLAGLVRLVVLFMFLPIAPASFKPPICLILHSLNAILPPPLIRSWISYENRCTQTTSFKP